MTLVVSLRIPDGIILAADSLSTVTGRLNIGGHLQTVCPECKKKISLPDLKMPPIPFPSSTFSYAQKLFPFKGKFGVASRGLAFLNNKSIHYHVQYVENSHKEEVENVTQAAKIFYEYFDFQIKKHVKDLNKTPDSFFPLGFHIDGYDDEEGKTKIVDIGKLSKIDEKKEIGCTVSGDQEVVKSLWELGKKDSRQKARYANFSLQDGIDYAEFLIRTTEDYQRFANMIPTVGGDIDIALITPFKDFTWIKRKKLMTILEKNEKGENYEETKE